METDSVAAFSYISGMMNQWVKEALEHAELSQAEATRRLTARFNWPDDRSILNKMTLGKRKVEASEAMQISELTGFPLPIEEEGKPAGIRKVTVAAHIQAGAWTEAWEWNDDDKYEVYVPDDPELRFFKLSAAETRGPSMNRRYPERTVLIFTDVMETKEQPIAGKRYIVERKRVSGEAEHTVKLLHVDADNKYWLLPESDDPRFQAAISVEDGSDDGDVVSIIGRVVFAVTRE